MTCVYTKTSLCIHKHRSVYTHVCHVHKFVYIHKFVCIHIYDLCIHTTVYVYTHVCHLHKFVYTQVSVYTHLRSVYTHKYELCTRLPASCVYVPAHGISKSACVGSSGGHYTFIGHRGNLSLLCSRDCVRIPGNLLCSRDLARIPGNPSTHAALFPAFVREFLGIVYARLSVIYSQDCWQIPRNLPFPGLVVSDGRESANSR